MERRKDMVEILPVRNGWIVNAGQSSYGVLEGKTTHVETDIDRLLIIVKTLLLADREAQ